VNLDDQQADDANPPPGWCRSRGFLCSCTWRDASVPGWLELVYWNPRCDRHPCRSPPTSVRGVIADGLDKLLPAEDDQDDDGSAGALVPVA
jgi:hypothetical protein